MSKIFLWRFGCRIFWCVFCSSDWLYDSLNILLGQTEENAFWFVRIEKWNNFGLFLCLLFVYLEKKLNLHVKCLKRAEKD